MGAASRRGLPWRNATWLGSLAALLTALGAIFVPLLTDGGGGGGGEFVTAGQDAPTSTTATNAAPTTGLPGARPSFDVGGGDVPLTVGVVPNQPFATAADYWAFEGVVPTDFPGRTGDELDQWLAGNARPAIHRAVRLTFRGTRPEPTVVNGVRVEVVGRSEPTADSYLFHAGGCGGMEVMQARVDLADPRLTLEWLGEPDGQAPTFSVAPDDPEVVEVVATSEIADARWRVIISYEFGGDVGELVIDDDGGPFTVAGVGPQAEAYQVAQGAGPTEVRVEREPRGDGTLLRPC